MSCYHPRRPGFAVNTCTLVGVVSLKRLLGERHSVEHYDCTPRVAGHPQTLQMLGKLLRCHPMPFLDVPRVNPTSPSTFGISHEFHSEHPIVICLSSQGPIRGFSIIRSMSPKAHSLLLQRVPQGHPGTCIGIPGILEGHKGPDPPNVKI